MKKKLENGNAVLALIVIGLLLYLLIPAVLDLANQKDVHTVKLNGAVSVLEIEHSINGLIPIGTDYYYLGYEDESNNAYVIKASKHWLDKKFDADYRALDQNGVEITALAKKVSDWHTSQELAARLSQMGELNYPIGAENCLVADYKKNAIVRLIDFVLLLCVAVTGLYIFSNKYDIKPVYIKVWCIGLLVSLMLCTRVIR